MRLTYKELDAIVNSFYKVYGSGKIYLFGSRIDDLKKGGDIDLYIKDVTAENILEKKLQFLALLQSKIGEQKIDIVFAKDSERLIEREAEKNAILLNSDRLKIQKYLNECDKHQLRIERAYKEIVPILPLSLKSYINLSEEHIRIIDQYLFRFSKLQGTIEEKLFPSIVDEFIEDSSRLTFVDKLNQLEKVQILDSVEEWKSLRNARNNIAHQYDDEPEEMADAINKIFAQKELLLSVYKNVKNFYK